MKALLFLSIAFLFTVYGCRDAENGPTSQTGQTAQPSAVLSKTDKVKDKKCGKPITYLGKVYNTVQIGSQCWLRENLDVGTMIQGSVDQTSNGTVEKYCYDDNPANCDTYGGLYQWDEAMQNSTTPGAQGICPPGWHLPTLAEFQTLSATVGGDGNALKAIGQGMDGGAGTNTSDFSAFLAGCRQYDGFFHSFGYAGYAWSSTEYSASGAQHLNLEYPNGNINLSYTGKYNGLSVRCLKD
jgi:uncharacterized protein (TIGR02145 family)